MQKTLTHSLELKLITRFAKLVDLEFISGKLQDKLFYQGKSMGSHYQVHFSHCTITRTHPNANYCTSILKVSIFGEKYNTEQLAQFDRLVCQTYLEWAKEEIKPLTQIKVVKAKVNYSNDNGIALFIQDPKFNIHENGVIEEKIADKWVAKKLSMFDGRYQIKYNGKNLNLSRIIFAKFNGKLDSSLGVTQKDGNRENNHKDNLIQADLSACNKLSFKHRREPVKGNVNLNEFQIARIKKLRASGSTYSEILMFCHEMNIPLTSKGHLSSIVNNKIWK